MRDKKIASFWDVWTQIYDHLKGKDILLALDYDGTLVPIAERPEQAFLSFETKMLLEKLTKRPDCHIAIVSGRSLVDLRRLIGIKNISYVGNHGFEIYGPNERFENNYFPKTRDIFNEIVKNLQPKLRNFSGVFIEDKKITISIHYRLLDERKEKSLIRLLQKLTKAYVSLKEIKICEGKKVYELRPPVEWDAGQAVLWLLNEKSKLGHREIKVIYVGDDEPDEDVFKFLKDIAITIRLGKPKKTAAQFYLDTPKDVEVLLKQLQNLNNN